MENNTMQYTDLTPIESETTPQAQDPIHLTFLAAVQRFDRLRSEVFSRKGKELIAKADELIEALIQPVARGIADIGEVMSLVKLAGRLNDYTLNPDDSILEIAEAELTSTRRLNAA